MGDVIQVLLVTNHCNLSSSEDQSACNPGPVLGVSSETNCWASVEFSTHGKIRHLPTISQVFVNKLLIENPETRKQNNEHLAGMKKKTEKENYGLVSENKRRNYHIIACPWQSGDWRFFFYICIYGLLKSYFRTFCGFSVISFSCWRYIGVALALEPPMQKFACDEALPWDL